MTDWFRIPELPASCQSTVARTGTSFRPDCRVQGIIIRRLSCCQYACGDRILRHRSRRRDYGPGRVPRPGSLPVIDLQLFQRLLRIQGRLVGVAGRLPSQRSTGGKPKKIPTSAIEIIATLIRISMSINPLRSNLFRFTLSHLPCAVR